MAIFSLHVKIVMRKTRVAGLGIVQLTTNPNRKKQVFTSELNLIMINKKKEKIKEKKKEVYLFFLLPPRAILAAEIFPFLSIK